MITKRNLFFIFLLELLCIGVNSLAADGVEIVRRWYPELDKKQALDMAEKIILPNVSETVDGVTITLTGVYYEEDQFLLVWESENDQPQNPVAVFYSQACTNDEPIIAWADYPGANWVPRVFGLGWEVALQNPADWYLPAQLEIYDATQSYTIKARFVVAQPQRKIVVVDAELYELHDDNTQADYDLMIHSIKQAGVEIAGQDQLDPTQWEEAGYIVLDRHGAIHDDGEFTYLFDYAVPKDGESGILQYVGEVVFEHTIPAKAAQ